MSATRGTTNGNARGSATDRRRRREWLVSTYRADVDLSGDYEGVHPDLVPEHHYRDGCWVVDQGHGIATCRCYRCGCLLTAYTVTVDRIVPGCKGGTYRRNNIRPACGDCNSETGGALRSAPKRRVT